MFPRMTFKKPKIHTFVSNSTEENRMTFFNSSTFFCAPWHECRLMDVRIQFKLDPIPDNIQGCEKKFFKLRRVDDERQISRYSKSVCKSVIAQKKKFWFLILDFQSHCHWTLKKCNNLKSIKEYYWKRIGSYFFCILVTWKHHNLKPSLSWGAIQFQINERENSCGISFNVRDQRTSSIFQLHIIGK